MGLWCIYKYEGARCSSVVGAFAHGAMGRRIDPSWGDGVSIYMKGARCTSVVRVFAHGAMGRRIDPSWVYGASINMKERDVAPW